MNEIKPSNTLEEKLGEFTPRQKEVIFKNSHVFQLTEGCSIGCRDCGAGALPGVRDYVPANTIFEILSQIPNNGSKLIALYFTSDPFDYDFDGINYVRIHQEAKKLWKRDLCTMTSIPKGKEELIFNLLLNPGQVNINRISLTKFNYKRIENAFNGSDIIRHQRNKGSGYETELSNGDFIESLKPFSFRHFLNYLGSRIQISDFYNKTTLNDSLRVNNKDVIKNDYPLINRLKVGENNKNNLDQEGIGCVNGAILTPKGVFNVQTVPISKENTVGEELTEISPSNFKVIAPDYRIRYRNYQEFCEAPIRYLTV